MGLKSQGNPIETRKKTELERAKVETEKQGKNGSKNRFKNRVLKYR